MVSKKLEVDLTFIVVSPKGTDLIEPVSAGEKVLPSRTKQEKYEATIILPFTVGGKECKTAEEVYDNKKLFFEKLYPIMKLHKEWEIGYALNALFQDGVNQYSEFN